MLHYNYSAPLSFLSGFGGEDSGAVSHDAEDGGSSHEDLSSRYMSPGGPPTPGGQGGKSFTIAAILGLKNDEKPTDLTVVNLSVHQGVADRLTDCRSRLLPGGLSSNRPSIYHQRPLGVTGLSRSPGKKSGLSSSHGPMSSSSGGGKSKRVRTIFTPEQLERLEAEFERQQYMVGPERLYLAHTLQLTEAQVKVWFQNRRIKWRKHHLEVTQQRLAAIKQRQMMAAVSVGTPPESIDAIDADESSSGTDT